MFFNFYLFGLLIYAALSSVSVKFFKDLLAPLGYEGGHLIDFSQVKWGLQLLIFFIIADFVQWIVHNILHRVPFLWKFHNHHKGCISIAVYGLLPS